MSLAVRPASSDSMSLAVRTTDDLIYCSFIDFNSDSLDVAFGYSWYCK